MKTLNLIVILVAITMFGEVVNAAIQPWESLLATAQGRIETVTSSDLRKSLSAKQSYVLIDVRENSEFVKGHIPGAINIPRGHLEFKIAATVSDEMQEIIVYCSVNRRAKLTQDRRPILTHPSA